MLKTLLLPGALLALGLTQPAAAQTKPTAAAPAAADLVDLNLTPQEIPLTLRVPKGTKASVNEYGLVTVAGPGVRLFISSEAVPKASVAGALKNQGSSMEAMGCKVMPAKNPLAVYGKSLHPKEIDRFEVAVENPTDHTYYFIDSAAIDAAKKPLAPSYAAASYAAALSAHYQAK